LGNGGSLEKGDNQKKEVTWKWGVTGKRGVTGKGGVTGKEGFTRKWGGGHWEIEGRQERWRLPKRWVSQFHEQCRVPQLVIYILVAFEGFH